jgi:hypothetical protein
MYQKERWAGGMAEEWEEEEKTPSRYFIVQPSEY